MENLFSTFSKLKILIIGDVMLDVYDWGKVERISPEAPVPIININRTEKRFGGAANVALNIKAMGANPILCSVIGDDLAGHDFLHLASENHLSTEGIIQSKNRPTTQKRRVISGSQHLLRIDSETDKPIIESENDELFVKIAQLLNECNLVVFEDYDKGVISPDLIQKVVQLCNKKNIPTTVDPKKRNFLYYQNVTLFKPNLKELKEGLKLDFYGNLIDDIKNALSKLDEQLHAENYLITLSENGVLLKTKTDYFHIKAHHREISDVSGAGDTVIAVASVCLAAGMHPKLMSELANVSGGLVCEHVGAVPINKNELLAEAKRLNLI
ncbi:MAG: D-glycero-beta-D-manno-heptose-7-phosphate kinase [Bacteroidetes bacterium]|nr:MAG: D-glycero-beta-D-manno-heptose-7-phosphate kinase [Bacteroidota bacterium]